MVKPLLITGMHRSYTSLTCRWLQACGLSFGDNLLKANYANPYGYFENIEIVEFHTDLLERSKTHIYPNKKPDFSEIDWSIQIKNLQDLVSDHQEAQIGIKDPRASLFLQDLWLKAFPELTMLFCFRHPFEVIHSLVKRENNSYDRSSLIEQIKYGKWKLMQKKWIERFKKSYLLYNQHIIDTINAYPNQTILINLSDCLQFDQQIIEWLNHQGYQLQFQKFHSVIDNDLIENVKEQYLSVKKQNEVMAIYNQLLAHNVLK